MSKNINIFFCLNLLVVLASPNLYEKQQCGNYAVFQVISFSQIKQVKGSVLVLVINIEITKKVLKMKMGVYHMMWLLQSIE